MKRLAALKTERESFIPHYKELADFCAPRRGRFLITDRNKGVKRYTNIINNRSTMGLKICTSGMLAGSMSPTRPWFSFETNDPERMEAKGVKEWLYKVELIMRTIFAESNFYGMASTMLRELILFGTAAMSHVDDFDDVARFYTHTAGSYMICQNSKYKIDTFVREFEWTVWQIVKEFGLDKVSTPIKTAWDKGDYDKWYPVIQIIEPNEEYNGESKLNVNKPFRSVYFEPGNTGETRDKWLSTSGFEEFPVYVPRWDLTGEDIYGTDCPGMTALGDIKGLQLEEKRKAQAIDKMVSPVLRGPPSLNNVPISHLPASAIIYDGDDSRQKLEPVYQVNPHLQELRADMDAIERRIDSAFYVDMFLAITNIEGIQPRNEMDLLNRNEEKLLQLGPVLERLHGEALDPLMDRLFNQAVRANILPPPPEALAGQPLKIKYISTLAMAQRAIATQSLDRLMMFAGQMAGFGMSDALMKIDAAQAIDEYAKAIGVVPTVIVPDETVQQIKEQQAQQQKAAAELEAAQGLSGSAKNLAQAKTGEGEGDNALNALMNSGS